MQILFSTVSFGMAKAKLRKRHVPTATTENGALNMLNIDLMTCTKHVLSLKKYLEDYPSPWKFFLDKRLVSVGGKFVLHCNFDITKLPVMLPPF